VNEWTGGTLFSIHTRYREIVWDVWIHHAQHQEERLAVIVVQNGRNMESIQSQVRNLPIAIVEHVSGL
jgi:hypothetical protein